MMKKLILFVLIGAPLSINAQTPTKTEGAHQAEYNARQHEVDGESGPSKTLPDARSVSTANEALSAPDSSTVEENTMAPVSSNQAALDGTGNSPAATLNVAGSPVPGSPKKATVKRANEISPVPARKKAPSPTGNKKKKKR